MTLQELINASRTRIASVRDVFNQPIHKLRADAEHAARRNDKTFFAPIYMSSVCASDCAYCGFRRSNKIRRYTLTQAEARAEACELACRGYTAAYCLTGSWNERSMLGVNQIGLEAICEAGLFPILESSPFSLRGFRELLASTGGIGRYVIFQERYNNYAASHDHNDPFKGDPDTRLALPQLALSAGWPEVGVGMLIGLHPDVCAEIACLLTHAETLERAGAQRISISVPRLTPAANTPATAIVTDEIFLRAVWTIRTLCPQALIVLTGREHAYIRDMVWPVTDVWGVQGSTVPGGYTIRHDATEEGQFSLTDRRSIQEIIHQHSYGS